MAVATMPDIATVPPLDPGVSGGVLEAGGVREAFALLSALVCEVFAAGLVESEDEIQFSIRYEYPVGGGARQRRGQSQRVPLSLAAAPLTKAELGVLAYLPTNLSFGDVAEGLCVSRNTVKTHALAIYRKLGVSTRGNAVRVALELGVLSPVTIIHSSR